MFETVEAIQNAIKNKETDLRQLRTRMQEDFDLFTLAEYESEDATGKKRKGYESYTSSASRNFFNKVLDGMNRAALSIQIKLPEDATEEARKAASKGELYLFGALAAIDRRQAKKGEPPLREVLGFFACSRGWAAMRALVYVPKGEKEVVFDVCPWDPLHVIWEAGANGLIWVAFKRRITRAQAKAENDYDLPSDEADAIDFWDSERNSVIVNGVFVKEPTAHNIGHPPVFIASVGSMPTMQPALTEGGSNPEDSLMEYRGDSVWGASRKLYKPFNKYVSRLMDTQERSVAGSLVHKSKDGKRTLDGDPYRTFQEIPVAEGEEISPLELPKAPAETGALLGIINDDIQRSTLPDPLSYGGAKEAMSGRALSVLADATRSVYSPGTSVIAQGYTWLCEELLSQYGNKGTRATTMRGFKGNGDFFSSKIKPTDIDPGWFVSVKVEPRLPRDKEAEIMMALAATQRRGPEQQQLMSTDTAREELVNMRDPDAEEDKVLAEMGKSMLPVMGPRIAKAMKDKGDDEGAEMFMAWLASQGLFKGPGQPGGAPGGQMGGGPPGAAPAGAPQGAPPPPIPPELVEAILQALIAAGQQDIGQAFAAAMDGQAPLTPELIEAIVQVLVESGQREMAAALLQSLGVVPPQATQGGPPPTSPPQQAPPGIPMGPPVG